MDNESRRNEMRKLRENGCTLQEIADKFGISKQRVAVIIKDVRYSNADIEKIAFKGIYELFVNDKTMTFIKFARFAINETGNTSVCRATRERLKRFIFGVDAHLTLTQINNILKLCGKPFEEVFALRDMGDKE